MQKASEEKPSGLMSVFLGRTSNLNTAMLAARKWCKEKLKLDEPIVCEIANYLFAQCKVIGGNKEALDFIELNHKEFNINRVKRLAVSGAFHTELMRSAQEPLALALKSIHIKKPIVKFYSNYTANLCTNPYQIKTNLIRQVSEPVKWEQILNQFYYDQNLPKENESGEQIKEDFLNDYELTSEEREEMNKKMVAQSAHRIYPDIYECGPASQTGPILRSINKKAFQLYKHVDV
jgi:[acyl-carrier-protein] S-malonyltransferase